ncbi:MAG: DUF2523 family protein [Pseudomonadota bacterium]
MATLSTVVMGLVAPVAKRALASLGFGFVTYVGVSAAVDQLLASAKSAWAAGSLFANASELVAMAGGNVALSIIAGAIVGRISMVTMKRLVPK